MQDSPLSSNSRRLESIDCLRGIAALAVVFLHAMTYGTPPPQAHWLMSIYDYSHYGALGVTLFFLISGFCIHLRWAQQQAAFGHVRLNWFTFWKRRLHRLYPPYFVVLCFSMGLVVIAYVLKRPTVVVTSYPEPKQRWMLLDFLAHVFMLHGLHPVFDYGAGNPPFWTLAREEYFYLLYLPLLALRQRVGLIVSFILVLIIGHYFPYFMSFVLPINSPYWIIIGSSAIVLWFQWCLGMVAVENHYGLVKFPRWGWFGLLLVLGILDVVNQHFYALGQGTELLCPLALFALLVGCVMLEREGQWPQHPLWRWLARVGTFSYSLYLIHMPMLSIVQRMLPTKLTQNPYIYLLNVLVIVVICYYAGLGFFLLVEQHFLNTRPVRAPQIAKGELTSVPQ